MPDESKSVQGLNQTVDDDDLREASDFYKRQYLLMKNVEKSLTKFRSSPAGGLTISSCEGRLESIRKYHREFRENHSSLVSYRHLETIKSQYFDIDFASDFEEMVIETMAIINEKMKTLQPAPKQPSTMGCTVTKDDELKLPEVKLPTFNGDYVQWPTFKEVFVSRVHDNAKLNDLQRFHHLKGALVGVASDDIQHLILTADNYNAAWTMLTTLYENKKILFTHYMETFEQQPAVREDSVSLKRFIQTSRSCFNAIKSLGVDLSTQNQVLVFYMVKKLPKTIRTEWDRHLSTKKNIPTFDELCTLLDQQHEMLASSSLFNKSIATTKPEHLKRLKSDGKRDVKAFLVEKSSKQSLCPHCQKENHSVRQCNDFLQRQATERRTIAQKLRLCYNCLSARHSMSQCESKHSCMTCNARHHTLLHIEGSNDVQPKMPSTSSQQNVAHTFHIACSPTSTAFEATIEDHGEIIPDCPVLLPTAMVTVKDATEHKRSFRALLDQCAQASFITDRAVQLLQLSRQKASLNLKLLEFGSGSGHQSVTIKLGSIHNDDVEYVFTAYILKRITDTLPESKLRIDEWTHLTGLQLADSKFFMPSNVDLLIGGNVYDSIIRHDIRPGKKNAPIAQLTTLGWIVSGKSFGSDTVQSHVLHTLIDSQLLRTQDELEETPQNNTEDEWAESFFVNTHRRQENGKYLVRLPLKTLYDPAQFIGESKSIAMSRLLQLERRLSRNEKLREAYIDTINEYLSLGQMKRVTSSENENLHRTDDGRVLSTCCYLPHHAVIKESSTSTKVRVVFDGSSRTRNGKSLNNILAVGPKIHSDMLFVLLNWRFFCFVYTADIEKMYRCIDLDETDAQYQRILWRSSPQEPVQELCCTTVMFGTASAPFVAIRTLHQLAADEATRYPLAVESIHTQMYVDDLLDGDDTIELAHERLTQIKQMLSGGGFELRKWSSNRPEIIKDIPVEHRQKNNILQLDDDDQIKALGMYWNMKGDCFIYQLKFDSNEKPLTRRMMSSMIARIFDPAGWLNPSIIIAKIILQQVWRLRGKWDDVVPKNIQNQWTEYFADLSCVTHIKIERWFHSFKTDLATQLHIFCSSTKETFSAVAYIRTDNDVGIRSTLVMSKAQVIPIKSQSTTIRAELCAMVLAAQLLLKLESNLKCQFGKNIFLWTDSTTILYWLQLDFNQFKPFVQNRLRKIHDFTTAKQWQFVDPKENPAVGSSGGVYASKLVNNPTWWNGPSWLQQEMSFWPKISIFLPPSESGEVELRKK